VTETAVSVSYSTVSDIPSRPTVALQKEDQRKAYLKQEMPDPLRMLWILRSSSCSMATLASTTKPKLSVKKKHHIS
jgi:hypothetical protein